MNIGHYQTGKFGEAVARRLYPAAVRATGPFDFALAPGGGDAVQVEAKCRSIREGLRFNDEQFAALGHHVIVVATLYDTRALGDRYARAWPLRLAHATQTVVVAPGALCVTLARPRTADGCRHVPATVLAREALASAGHAELPECIALVVERSVVQLRWVPVVVAVGEQHLPRFAPRKRRPCEAPF